MASHSADSHVGTRWNLQAARSADTDETAPILDVAAATHFEAGARLVADNHQPATVEHRISAWNRFVAAGMVGTGLDSNQFDASAGRPFGGRSRHSARFVDTAVLDQVDGYSAFDMTANTRMDVLAALHWMYFEATTAHFQVVVVAVVFVVAAAAVVKNYYFGSASS